MPLYTLYYAHDPMCSWCYGFSPTWTALQTLLRERYTANELKITYLVGGLAPDSNEPMPLEMRDKLAATWQHIANLLGTEFNFDFWQQNTPRRATYPACRAALLARDANKEEAMIAAIQKAYYRSAKNPSDLDILVECASNIGLEPTTFLSALQEEATDQRLHEEIAFARQMGLNSFPSLALVHQEQRHDIALDYELPENMLRSIQSLIKL